MPIKYPMHKINSHGLFSTLFRARLVAVDDLLPNDTNCPVICMYT